MLPFTNLCQRYSTDVTNGMTSEAVEASRNKFGWNRLRKEKKRKHLFMFLDSLFGGFALLLWTGSAFCFLANAVHNSPFEHQPKDNLYLGVALIGVAIVTGSFSFYQQKKSSRIMQSFNFYLPQYILTVH